MVNATDHVGCLRFACAGPGAAAAAPRPLPAVRGAHAHSEPAHSPPSLPAQRGCVRMDDSWMLDVKTDRPAGLASAPALRVCALVGCWVRSAARRPAPAARAQVTSVVLFDVEEFIQVHVRDAPRTVSC